MDDERPPQHNHDFPAVNGTPPGQCPGCDYYKNWPGTLGTLDPATGDPVQRTPDGSGAHVMAARIADALIADLMGRNALEETWDEIDRDVRQEIRSDWIDLARGLLEAPADAADLMSPTVLALAELVRTARGLIRTAHPTDVGQHEVVRQWWDGLVAAVEALPPS